MTTNDIVRDVVADEGFKEWCIEHVKTCIEDLEHMEAEERLDALKKLKDQTVGVRDIFFLLTLEQISDVMSPIGEAIKRAELELEGGE